MRTAKGRSLAAGCLWALCIASCGGGGTPTGGGGHDAKTGDAVRRDGRGGEAKAGTCGTASNPIVVGPGTSLTFSPSSCSVAAGSTVHWTWGSSLSHTVTSDAGAPISFDSGFQNAGFNFAMTIPSTLASGTVIHYHCNTHVSFGMVGSLTVL